MKRKNVLLLIIISCLVSSCNNEATNNAEEKEEKEDVVEVITDEWKDNASYIWVNNNDSYNLWTDKKSERDILYNIVNSNCSVKKWRREDTKIGEKLDAHCSGCGKVNRFELVGFGAEYNSYPYLATCNIKLPSGLLQPQSFTYKIEYLIKDNFLNVKNYVAEGFNYTQVFGEVEYQCIDCGSKISVALDKYYYYNAIDEDYSITCYESQYYLESCEIRYILNK